MCTWRKYLHTFHVFFLLLFVVVVVILFLAYLILFGLHCVISGYSHNETASYDKRLMRKLCFGEIRRRNQKQTTIHCKYVAEIDHIPFQKDFLLSFFWIIFHLINECVSVFSFRKHIIISNRVKNSINIYPQLIMQFQVFRFYFRKNF